MQMYKSSATKIKFLGNKKIGQSENLKMLQKKTRFRLWSNQFSHILMFSSYIRFFSTLMIYYLLSPSSGRFFQIFAIFWAKKNTSFFSPIYSEYHPLYSHYPLFKSILYHSFPCWPNFDPMYCLIHPTFNSTN